MAKEKFYAVKTGKTPGIYRTWEECQKQIDGFSGEKHKSFTTLKEAEEYLSSPNPKNDATKEESTGLYISGRIASLGNDEALTFARGCYDSNGKNSAYGAILITAGGRKKIMSGMVDCRKYSDHSGHGSLAAEATAIVEAIKMATAAGKKKIVVYHCNEMTGKLVSSSQTRATPHNELTREYVSFVDACRSENSVEIEFKKIPSRSDVELNEEAHSLAKAVLYGEGYKTHKDGTLYFFGFTKDKWTDVINGINEENRKLDGTIEPLAVSTEKQGNRTLLRVSQAKNTVTISCYSNSNSSVQGSQSALLRRLVSHAVGLLEDKQNVVEVLNSFYFISIPKDKVEIKFDALLPNYKPEKDDLFLNELKQAVYNSMLTGPMWDCTYLMHPIFMALDFYLDKVLRMEMGLLIGMNKGIRISFGHYFKMINNGTYTFDPNKAKNQTYKSLNSGQAGFLDRLYTMYAQVRNVYSHWTARTGSNQVNAIINDTEITREYIEKGLKLCNEYYLLFS